jgi:hypothetical protein
VQRVATRQTDVTNDSQRAQVRETIGRRKLEDEYNRFLQELRGEAYVSFRSGDRGKHRHAAAVLTDAPRARSGTGRARRDRPELVSASSSSRVKIAGCWPSRRPGHPARGRGRAEPAATAARGRSTRPRRSAPARGGNAAPAGSARPIRPPRAVIGALLGAGQACLSGELHGVVTGPVHKAVINQGGIAYSGTTELLADQAGVKVVMMLANHIVRVALATTPATARGGRCDHRPGLEHTLRTVHAALRREFACPRHASPCSA